MSGRKEIYAVIDTNVLVSASMARHSWSNAVRVWEFIVEGKIVPLYNSEMLEEYRDVLSRPKFKFNPDSIDTVISVITRLGIKTEGELVGDEIFPDKDDIVFYRVALGQDDS